MATPYEMTGFHDLGTAAVVQKVPLLYQDTKFSYTFENFSHPFVGELIAKLNTDSLPGMLDPTWQDELRQVFFDALYLPNTKLANVTSFPDEIDVSTGGPYANYNWELFFHIPLTIAVHLSKNQRFAEAQRWFHYIFDPTSNDQGVDPETRFWKFLAFRKPEARKRIEDIVRTLSTPRSKLPPDKQKSWDETLRDYDEIRDKPFHPHVVARTRPLAYQYAVVMKYEDNLIAWGDHLFELDTVESINEATQLYVLAANILGERPQRVPPRGTVTAKTFAQLTEQGDGLGPIGDALVDLEGQHPFNLAAPSSARERNGGHNALFGIGRALYFCIPANDKLLGYWDTVADRLFKIRHCMTIQGIVRPLALFDPPIDPGMLVKAAAAGIDVASIVSGLNQPAGPVRSLFLIQKALELCGEVRNLGNALLSALEKGDAEHLALVRQRHEIQVQQMAQQVRFLQWKSAQEGTRALLLSRNVTVARLQAYRRLLGLAPDPNAPDIVTPDVLQVEWAELNSDNFDEAYSALVEQYGKVLTRQALPDLKLVGDTAPDQQSGVSGQGRLYLNENEHTELNQLLPEVKNNQAIAFVGRQIAPVFSLFPDFPINFHFWGIGGTIIFGGSALTKNVQTGADVLDTMASRSKHDAESAAKTGSYQRRSDEYILQYNLAAYELMHIGRQILGSLIAEQAAHREYLNIQKQIENAQEVDEFFRGKFTNEDLYLWMQGETSRLYYEFYRFAFETARKAERTMRQELMRPELDAQDFIKFGYWDGGRKGLLSGEALYLDVKRMEMAYHANNRRELELTKHVSLRQLDPLALLTLRTTGSCIVTIPEWLYDLDCPGHYMRRIKSVALTIPSVAGPYTGVNCTLSLLRSSLRKSPDASDGYPRRPSDDRFVDYAGAVQSIVTSAAQNDSGMFETNLRDERFLPFEGAGAESTWKLDLPDPNGYPAFDYATISDVVLHIRYTARHGINPGEVATALHDLFEPADQAGLALLFSLDHDFPTEWAAFANGAPNFSATILQDHFPYFAQHKTISVNGLELYDGNNVSSRQPVGSPSAADATAALADPQKKKFTVTAAPGQVLMGTADAQVFLVIRYSLS